MEIVIGVLGLAAAVAAFFFVDWRSLRHSLSREGRLRRQAAKFEFPSHLSHESLVIVMSQCFGWNYLLLSQLCQEEFDLRSDFKVEVQHGSTHELDHLRFEEWRDWMLAQFNTVRRQAAAVGRVLSSINQTMTETKRSELVKGISRDARALGAIYEDSIRTRIAFQRVYAGESVERMMQVLARELGVFQDAMDTFPDKIRNAINEAERNGEKSFTLVLELPPPDLSEFSSELERLVADVEATGRLPD